MSTQKSFTDSPRKTLDLGCGNNPHNPFHAAEVYGIDLQSAPPSSLEPEYYSKVDLGIEELPFTHDFFDYVTAYDVLEHIPRIAYTPKRVNPFIELMNEIARVLKPNGIFYSLTPVFPAPEAFQDPTHVNIMTEKTMSNYFAGEKPYARRYGFKGNFIVIHQSLFADSHLNLFMRKHAPISDASTAHLRQFQQ